MVTDRDNPTASEESLQPRASATRRPARIVIAEDDAELGQLLARALGEDGYHVELVASGAELLARLSQPRAAGRQVDLVISDIHMPGPSGLEVLAGLRSPQRPGDWSMPVILITSFGDPETHRAAKRLGAVIFDKPFDIDDLRTCAVNMVRRASDPGKRPWPVRRNNRGRRLT